MKRREIATGLGAATLAAGAAMAQSPLSRATPPPMIGAITEVPGIKVGHFTDSRRPTGCTVILTEEGATAGVDVRGAAPGTRETDLLNPANLVEKVHAVLLSGGSAFGLEAATGVVRWLEEKGIGYPAGPARVPIVPAAILFDLGLGDHRIRPDAAAGHAACEAASAEAPAEGSVGAGTGATVGKLFGMARAMKGGIGTASVRVGAITVGAIVAVNAVGDVIDPATGEVMAGARDAEGRRPFGATAGILRGELPPPMQAGMATTIGVVATDATLTKAQCGRLAGAAHDGLARTIDPIHTMSDGDTVFALATGKSGLPGNMMALGAVVPHVMAAAVLRAVRAAKAVGGSPPGMSELR
ncbi:P1 family peptidase [Muricoccus pecuniae]|uniref:L-aminopeptidase/D-esterase-like protein n=1 Tax=Muricoccus pecuniae TaxID=693023 RepID=A0A840Y0B2_9PROT|nr:P1 family peptidase [Roseomonas pecuniae]MBB5694548.1 L-aminopeptidase/D-esterase-like protein [Roseomonas pecuniae]